MTNEEKIWVLTNMRYDVETGVLERWATHNGGEALKTPQWKVCSLKPAVDGYARVKVLGKMQKYHRICWLLAHRDIDDDLQINHIDGDRLNNKLGNLRLVTARENQQNQHKHREGSLVGCYWNKPNQKWLAQIQINGKRKHLGYFDTEQEAHAAYVGACNLLAIEEK